MEIVNQGLQPQVISFEAIESTLRKLIENHGADTFLGSMPSTKGTFVLLFSHRLNKEFSFVIQSSEPAKVLSRVYEVLAQSGREDHASAH